MRFLSGVKLVSEIYPVGNGLPNTPIRQEAPEAEKYDSKPDLNHTLKIP